MEITRLGRAGRLHAKGYIADPKSKAKSVVMTEAGAKRASELLEKHFATKGTLSGRLRCDRGQSESR
jgi:Mn-dependent DtxR family transcriptional regulator